LVLYIYIESQTTPVKQISCPQLYKDATNMPNDGMVLIDKKERDSLEIHTEGTFNIIKFNYHASHIANVKIFRVHLT